MALRFQGQELHILDVGLDFGVWDRFGAITILLSSR